MMGKKKSNKVIKSNKNDEIFIAFRNELLKINRRENDCPYYTQKNPIKIIQTKLKNEISKLEYIEENNRKKNNFEINKNLHKSTLKYYLKYKEPGIAKKSLLYIYKDFDNIQKSIDIYENKLKEKESMPYLIFNKDINKNIKKAKSNIHNHSLIINIPDLNIINEKLTGFCRAYEHFRDDCYKIKNIFNTKVNIYERQNIIKNTIKVNSCFNNSYDCRNNKSSLSITHFPEIKGGKSVSVINKKKDICSFRGNSLGFFPLNLKKRNEKQININQTEKSPSIQKSNNTNIYNLTSFSPLIKKYEKEREINGSIKLKGKNKRKENKANIEEADINSLNEICKDVIKKLRIQKIFLKSLKNKDKQI